MSLEPASPHQTGVVATLGERSPLGDWAAHTTLSTLEP